MRPPAVPSVSPCSDTYSHVAVVVPIVRPTSKARNVGPLIAGEGAGRFDVNVWAKLGITEPSNVTSRTANAERRAVPRIRDCGRVIGTVSPWADSIECIFLIFGLSRRTE